jgi:hypothetical protein
MRQSRVSVLTAPGVSVASLCSGEWKVESLTLKQVEKRLLREYLDLPGLRLSLAQVARLLSVDAPICQVVLNELVTARCLAHDASGRYVREVRYDDLATWKTSVRRRLASGARSSSPTPTKAATLERRQSQRLDRVESA